MKTLRLVSALLATTLTAGAQRVTVTVLATTDLHGNIYPYDYYTARPADRGLAKLATLIAAARRQNPNSVLIDAGDTIQGTPIETIYEQYVRNGRLPLGLSLPAEGFKADPMMLAMNHLGYDAMTLGNHEFNFGLKVLDRARADARFPWLSANTETEPGSGRKPFAPYIVKTVAGVKIAIIGITTPAIPQWEKPEHYAGLRFLPPKDAAARAVAELKAGPRPDVIVAAVHAGLERAPGEGGENMAGEIAAQVPGIDAIVFGHSHQQVAGQRIGEVLLMQPKNWGISLGRMDFDLERQGGGWKIAGKSSRLIPVTAQTQADAELLRLARPYHEAAERYLNTPVARSTIAMDGRYARIVDSALLDAVQAVQLHYAHADVSLTALFNPGVRVAAGAVTVRQIAALYLYDNQLYAVQGNGKMLREALENAARFFLTCPEATCATGPLLNRQVAGFNFDVAQGVEYEIDLRQPEGRRVRNLRWHGKPLGDDQPLRIAINNYRAAGSGGYAMFRDAEIVWRSTEEIRDLIVAYYTERGSLPEKPDNNWRIAPPAAVETLKKETAIP
ncbi:MAG: 5'-nucleotidase C-terminal domain-containing protein [Bryobacterales bacterium]|nr:5'-nucleotidase C-terminal domain-containing protein [Bryobacterales bacterium]